MGKIYTEWKKTCEYSRTETGAGGGERTRLYMGSRGYKEVE